MDFDWKDFDAQMKGRAGIEDCLIPQDFEERLEKHLEELPAQARSKKRLGRRIIAIMAAVLILTGSALAISPTLREQLSRALGLFEAYTTPFKGASAVDQGVEIRLLSAMADEYTVRIYLEVQDHTGTQPMENICDILIDFLTPKEGTEIRGMTSGTKLLGYEEDTHTALVELHAAGENYSQMRDWNLCIDGIAFYYGGRRESIYGTWEIPFTLTPLETRTISLNAGDHSDFYTLKISPIGMVLEGGPDSFVQTDDTEVTFADGQTMTIKSGAGSGGMGRSTRTWYFDKPVSPEEIVRLELPCWTITLNGTDEGSVTRK